MLSIEDSLRFIDLVPHAEFASLKGIQSYGRRVDCLTGTGPIPAEGQALLEWMLANEARWRIDSFDEAGQVTDANPRYVAPSGVVLVDAQGAPITQGSTYFLAYG